MAWKNFVRDYLTFSKKERIAAFCLLLLAALVYVLPKLFSAKAGATLLQADTTLLNDAAEQAKEKSNISSTPGQNTSVSFYEPTINRGYTEGELFTFDPNTLPTEGWLKLGLNNRTIQTLNNYRSKGGRFYKPDDLKKIWGLPQGFYARVAPYIQIAGNRPIYDPPATESSTPKGKRSISVVEVNNADTAELIALPGIGAKLAARIINFRDKLGGFYTTEQIRETYGLPDSTFQLLQPYLQVNAAAVKKINLNTATKDELRAHPYIKWALANAIVEYRERHGTFSNLEELKNIMLIDETTFSKIAPYFSL